MTEGNERNCNNCKNYVPLPDRPDLKGCCKWDCEYEPKEDEDGEHQRRAELRLAMRPFIMEIDEIVVAVDRPAEVLVRSDLR